MPHRPPLPPGIGELKVSRPSLLCQLPLAPVFQPTAHMRHGELDPPAQPVPSGVPLTLLFERWGQFDMVPKRKDSEVGKRP